MFFLFYHLKKNFQKNFEDFNRWLLEKIFFHFQKEKMNIAKHFFESFLKIFSPSFWTFSLYFLFLPLFSSKEEMLFSENSLLFFWANLRKSNAWKKSKLFFSRKNLGSRFLKSRKTFLFFHFRKNVKISSDSMSFQRMFQILCIDFSILLENRFPNFLHCLSFDKKISSSSS